MGGHEWLLYLFGALLLAIVIAVISGFFLHHKYVTRIFRRQVWRKLYHLAQDQDYYLLNEVAVKTESDTLHIDHMLVGDKFVYVISARYYEDNLAGKSYVDRKWSITDKNGNVLCIVSNPVIFNEKRTMYLAKFLGWNNRKSPMFISIVVINNSTDVAVEDQRISPYSYLIHKKDISRLIRKIERETNLPPFDDQSLLKIINRIHRLSADVRKEETLGKPRQES